MIERAPIRQIPVERRKHNFEEVGTPPGGGGSHEQARRCLRCDYGKHINEEGANV